MEGGVCSPAGLLGCHRTKSAGSWGVGSHAAQAIPWRQAHDEHPLLDASLLLLRGGRRAGKGKEGASGQSHPFVQPRGNPGNRKIGPLGVGGGGSRYFQLDPRKSEIFCDGVGVVVGPPVAVPKFGN